MQEGPAVYSDAMRWIVLLTAALVSGSSVAGQELSASEKIQEERLIGLVKGTPAKELDAALPKMRFERWLMDVVGKDVELAWEVNDCGEDSGDATGARRDIPACVEASAKLSGQRTFAVHVQVGTFGGKTQKPRVRGVYLQVGRKLTNIEKLRELPKQLTEPKPPA